MKKLKNKFEKIVSLIMFISLIINIIPNAMASEVKYIEEAYVQRSISISEYDALNIKNEIGNSEEENPGEETKPDEGEEEDPSEETKPDEGEEEDPSEETKPDEGEEEKPSKPNDEEKPQEPGEGEKEDPGEETKPDEGEEEDPSEETKPDEGEEEKPSKPNDEEKPQEPDEGEKDDPDEETKPDEGEKEDPGEDTKPDEFGTDKEPDEPVEIAKIDEQELRIHEKKPAQLPEMPEKNDEVIPQQEPNNITLERVNNNNTYEIPRTGDKNSTLLDIAMTLTIMSATLIAILSICKRKKQK